MRIVKKNNISKRPNAARDRLMTKKEVIKTLGIRSDDKVWTKDIKPTLVNEYGMCIMEGGTRIFKSNFERFLKEKFKKKSEIPQKKFAE